MKLALISILWANIFCLKKSCKAQMKLVKPLIYSSFFFLFMKFLPFAVHTRPLFSFHAWVVTLIEVGFSACNLLSKIKIIMTSV